MIIYINDKPKEVDREQSISDILSGLDFKGAQGKKGIAVAVNNEVIARHKWASYRPAEHAKIIIITATQGG
jgi:sulfur carrier protein